MFHAPLPGTKKKWNSNTANTARRWAQKCNNHLIGPWRHKTLQKKIESPSLTRLFEKVWFFIWKYLWTYYLAIILACALPLYLLCFPAFCLSSSLIYFSVPLFIYSDSALVYRRTVQLPMCHLFGISLKIKSLHPHLLYIARRFFFSTRLSPRKPRSCLFIFFPPHLFAAEVRSVETVFLLACPQLPALEKSRRLGFARTTIHHCYLQRAGLVRPSLIPSKPKPRLTISCTIAQFWSRTYWIIESCQVEMSAGVGGREYAQAEAPFRFVTKYQTDQQQIRQ